MVARHGTESEHYSSRYALGSVCALTAVPALLLFGLAQVFIPLIFGHTFGASIASGRILSVAGIPLGVGNVLGDIIRGTGRPGYVATAEFLGLIVTVVGLWLFLPRFGILAASWVSLFSYTTVLLASSLLYYSLHSKNALCVVPRFQ
jgi:O-antigen/teichoic acid export membrane protein